MAATTTTTKPWEHQRYLNIPPPLPQHLYPKPLVPSDPQLTLSSLLLYPQILLFMMTITAALSWTYLLVLRIPASPPNTRLLLSVRGTAGFFGIWGFYYSLRYLGLAEATMLNFMAPVLAVLVLGLFPGQRVSVAQLLAGLLSTAGVVCVLQPWRAGQVEDPAAHLKAVAAALVGVAGGAVSYVAMARLGDRAHPLLSVAYFATFCVVLSGVLLGLQAQKLRLPSTPVQWCLAGILGVLGFAMHWLMTASLTYDGDDAKRPLNFVYTQILFAMLTDKLVWDISPDGWKYVGGLLIICSAIFVASTQASHNYALVRSHVDDDDIELERSEESDMAAKEME